MEFVVVCAAIASHGAPREDCETQSRRTLLSIIVFEIVNLKVWML
jgi:hypothetical protein